MELTNEIKVKVFAQYLGCKIELDNGGSKVRNRKLIAVGGIDDCEYVKLRMVDLPNRYTHSILVNNNNFKLILKPLSAITDEDIIKVAEIEMANPINLEIKREINWIKCISIREYNSEYVYIANNWSDSFWDNDKEYADNENSRLSYDSYQCLQSKGYDLPHYLLNGQTLEQAGLAIYK